MKVGIVLAPGFEDAEGVTITEVLRQGNINCRILGFDKSVTGCHGTQVKCDEILNKNTDYDCIILPGGYAGVDYLLDNETIHFVLNRMNREGKLICAMCAAPIVLDKAGLLKDKKYTAYRGYDQKIKDGKYMHQNVVIDGNIITGFAPALCYEFAFAIVDALGGDSKKVKEEMCYNNFFGENQ